MWRHAVLIGGLGTPVATTLTGCASHPPLEQRVAVPAYWTPASPTGQASFQQLARSASATSIVVVNGSHSAPETPYNRMWADTFELLSGAGVRALGYVDTGYLGIDFGPGSNPTRSGQHTSAAWTAQIENDIDTWYALYGASGVGGIFLDQTAAVCGPNDEYVQLYRSIADYVRKSHPGAYLVMNPGQAMEQCYEDVADTFVTFEGAYRDYQRRVSPRWEEKAPASKFWHLVYGVPNQVSMANAIALSKQRNARYVYVTNGILNPHGRIHPWDAIPPDPIGNPSLQRLWAGLLASRATLSDSCPTARALR